MNIRLIANGGPERSECFFIAIQIDEVVLPKGRIDPQSVQGTARNELACPREITERGPGKGIDVNVIEGRGLSVQVRGLV